MKNENVVILLSVEQNAKTMICALLSVIHLHEIVSFAFNGSSILL